MWSEVWSWARLAGLVLLLVGVLAWQMTSDP